MPNLNSPMFYAENDHVLNVIKKEPYAADECACAGGCKEQSRKMAPPLKYGAGQPCKKGENASKTECEAKVSGDNSEFGWSQQRPGMSIDEAKRVNQGKTIAKGADEIKIQDAPEPEEKESTAGWISRAAAGVGKAMDWLSGRSEGNDWKRKMHPPMKKGGSKEGGSDGTYGGDGGWSWNE